MSQRPLPPKRSRPGSDGGMRPKTTRLDARMGRRRGAQPPNGQRLPLILGVGAIAVAVVAAAYFLSGSFGTAGAGPAASRSTTGCPTAQPAALASGQTRTVTIATAKGNIVIKVEGTLSPIAAGNFVALAACGFYNGLGFHRVVPNFVIQGGDPKGDGSGGPGYTITDEPVTQPYKRGTVAMARSSAPNSQGSQFFIVLSDTNTLAATNTYAIFGSVVTGMDAVDAIAAAADGELPTHPIAMTSVTVSNP
jgi:cyclophilin family peptidyl-prolyl cis-trans isomerase